VVLFDRYRLDRELGRGGVADVWEAHDERLDRSVAIKILHPELLPDAGWRRRFIAEARAASGLSHPGIVPVYDVIDDPRTPAIVFQLVDGESLATRLRRVGSLEVDDATRMAGQVADALDHAHGAGLVHRDVKPANIVIGRDGRARLVDFGIARLVEEADAERDGREVVGTLRYMAPEQLAGRPADARTDLYALGLVISEMLPDLSTAPPWLRELVDRLRATDPADRPRSAADVARALESGRTGLLDQSGALGGQPAADDAAGHADAVVDPDAMTRSYPEPIEPVAPAPAAALTGVAESAAIGAPVVSAAAVLPEPAATAAPVVPGPLADRAPAEVPAPAVRPTGAAEQPRRADRRPVIAALLVAGVLVAGVALGRGAFQGTSGGAATPRPTPIVAPTQAPAAQPAPAKPHPHGHGHGHGG